MTGLIQQASEIAALAHTVRPAANSEPCPRCTDSKGCWLHPFHTQNLMRARKMPRAAWYEMRHRSREQDREREAQAADLENWLEQAGYPMPYSVQLSKGYTE